MLLRLCFLSPLDFAMRFKFTLSLNLIKLLITMAKDVITKVTLFWFRRDLRLEDNAGLYEALKARQNVLPIFIFDSDILSGLKDPQDARVHFIHETLRRLKEDLHKMNSEILVRHGKPIEVFKSLLREYQVEAVYTNHDYEPAARKRDEEIAKLCLGHKIEFVSFKDQTLFEKDEILSGSGTPYTVYTPYKKKVLQQLNEFHLKSYPVHKYKKSFLKTKENETLMPLSKIGFKKSTANFPQAKLDLKLLEDYATKRDLPAVHGTTHVGLHLRFGTLSIRRLARIGQKHSAVWLSELIWRDFFMQILWHFPHVEKNSFRPRYDEIQWRNSKSDFKKWCEGRTGYPLVDAGMRELNETGFMHNRVRMVTASFLCKHLLHHWYDGERYFAEKLLDYDLAANNGNWQWAAGSGCDAAPYFRISIRRLRPNALIPKMNISKNGFRNMELKTIPRL